MLDVGSADGSVLEFDRLSVRYGEGAPAVQGISLRVARAERVVLLGPSGSGKTTLLNVAAGIVAPTAGSWRLFGVDPLALRPRSLRSLRAHVGMVHQQLHLVAPLKVIHNVNAGALGSWSMSRAVRSLLRPVEPSLAVAVLDRLGIGEKAFARTSSLSGGQQQRVALARVLRQQPNLILADEPVSAVDPTWSAEVLRLLGEEVRERHAAVVIALHDVELARSFGDRLVGVRDGRVIFDGPPSAVTDDMISALYAFGAPRLPAALLR